MARSKRRDDEGLVSVAVERKRPRLVWRGMERQEAARGVPSRIVEIVHPGRATTGDDEHPGAEPRLVTAHDGPALPSNRLIWTRDNLVALRSLLDERDPTTGEPRYRAKVDLAYMDPPFMVNSDFRAAEGIEIDLEPPDRARREPARVELPAYRDTWREGLDSFLTMLRARLVLVAELLAPTGNVFVHLDWHAVHYVKVLMDEIFGYEGFVNEIVWQRQTSHSDRAQGARHLGRVHDTILYYRRGPDAFTASTYLPYEPGYVRSHWGSVDADGRRFQWGDITGPGGAAKGNPRYERFGHLKHWRYSQARMDELVAEGRVAPPRPGAVPRLKRFLDEMPGVPIQDVWTDPSPINSQAREAAGYPTQKPVALLQRIVEIACPPGGLVLDCFAGTGTTAEAAERLGRRWICMDNGKHAVHLARKRLILLHGQPQPPAAPTFEYLECDRCHHVERREASGASPGPHAVRPFTVEDLGAHWLAQGEASSEDAEARQRDELVRVLGGEPSRGSARLHGRKRGAWVHVGPLHEPMDAARIRGVAREAGDTDERRLVILAAGFEPSAVDERAAIERATGVELSLRIVSASALDVVRRRLELEAPELEAPLESMAIPAFYSPLSITLGTVVRGRRAQVSLERCDVDVESLLASQRPSIPPLTATMPAARRTRAEARLAKWRRREQELRGWLARPRSWEKLVDAWAIDGDHGHRRGADGEAIFETRWQSLRVRRAKGIAEPLVLRAELAYDRPGRYCIAARVIDVFGNDGLATTEVEIR